MPTNERARAWAKYVPRLSAGELVQRNQAAIRLLDSFEQEGDEAEQRETLKILREALGDRRAAGYRQVFS